MRDSHLQAVSYDIQVSAQYDTHLLVFFMRVTGRCNKQILIPHTRTLTLGLRVSHIRNVIMEQSVCQQHFMTQNCQLIASVSY